MSMSAADEVEARFKSLGAAFLIPVSAMAERLANTRVFFFDWDGVFNRGDKGDTAQSTFSEPDSMGTNLLRYAYWRVHGELPRCVIVSGADNPTARRFAARERFNAVFTGVRDKLEAFEAFADDTGESFDRFAYVFDDVNDFGAAALCGLRFMVRREASTFLHDYAARNSLCDYVTAVEAGRYAVREVTELLIALYGQYEAVVASRTAHDEEYSAYFEARQSVVTTTYGKG
jgi:3-deoxy-D-manno-octulosonate 8-phosphate phosphatase (KDO 8-P phosphatase)